MGLGRRVIWADRSSCRIWIWLCERRGSCCTLRTVIIMMNTFYGCMLGGMKLVWYGMLLSVLIFKSQNRVRYIESINNHGQFDFLFIQKKLKKSFSDRKISYCLFLSSWYSFRSSINHAKCQSDGCLLFPQCCWMPHCAHLVGASSPQWQPPPFTQHAQSFLVLSNGHLHPSLLWVHKSIWPTDTRPLTCLRIDLGSTS